MGSLFGGNKQSSTSSSSSSNQSYDFLKNQFGGLTGMATSGADAFQKLLSGDTSGFDAYKKATGFDAMAEQGSRGITGNAAAGGLLRSGGTGKALQSYGQQIQDQASGNYFDRLMQQAGMGFNAGNLLSGAGNVSKSESSSSGKSKNGLGGLFGGIASGIAASDRRLKKNIFKIGTLLKGKLNLYQYRYLDNSGPFVGVMADEVSRVRPEALGPSYFGYNTVNYSLLEA